MANMPLPDPSWTGFTNNGNGSPTASASSTVATSANGAVATPHWVRICLVRVLCSASASVSESLAVQGMSKNSQSAGTWASRLGPWRPSAMLKTRCGRARASFCGKKRSASRRTTSPKRLRACSTASMVERSSHSTNASLPELDGSSRLLSGSGFSLYARPMRMWSRVTSYKKGRVRGGRNRRQPVVGYHDTKERRDAQ